MRTRDDVDVVEENDTAAAQLVLKTTNTRQYDIGQSLTGEIDGIVGGRGRQDRCSYGSSSEQRDSRCLCPETFPLLKIPIPKVEKVMCDHELNPRSQSRNHITSHTTMDTKKRCTT